MATKARPIRKVTVSRSGQSIAVEQTRFHLEPDYKQLLKNVGDKVDWFDFTEYVRQLAAERKACGAMTSEVDFAYGAGCALFYFSHQDKLPSGWIFNVMAGKSPFGFDAKEKK